MKNRKLLLVFLALFLFGAVLRLFKLDQFPPQLNRDEAALALNGLYIMQGGMDEWGERLPLQFKSFGDYKLPGYIYLLSVLFRIGINDFIVRVPSALAGILLIFVTPFWIWKLFQRKLSNWSYFFIIASIVAAPFAFFYSRMAWEANMGLGLMISSLVFLHHQQPSWKKDLLATFLYTIAVLTYNSPLLLLPFIILTLPLLRGLKKYKSWLLPVSFLFIVFVGTLIIFSQNNSQKSKILLMNDPSLIDAYPVYRSSLPGFLKPIVGSRPAYFAQIVIRHYIDTFLPNFLIIKGGEHPWHSILGRGHLHWTIYVLFLAGVVGLVKDIKKSRKNIQQLILLFLLLVSPLPAIFTTDAPHATRSLFTFVMIVVIAGVGCTTILKLFKKYSRKVSYGVMFFIFSFLLLESVLYFYQYFVVWPKNGFSRDFNLDLGNVLQTGPVEHKDGNVAIIDYDLYPYVILSWYQRIPLQTALTTTEREGPNQAGLFRVTRVDRYYFIKQESEYVPNQLWTIKQKPSSQSWEMITK